MFAYSSRWRPKLWQGLLAQIKKSEATKKSAHPLLAFVQPPPPLRKNGRTQASPVSFPSRENPNEKLFLFGLLWWSAPFLSFLMLDFTFLTNQLSEWCVFSSTCKGNWRILVWPQGSHTICLCTRPYNMEQSTANSNSFKIAQKTAFEAKGRLYTTGKVIQRLFIIDLYT